MNNTTNYPPEHIEKIEQAISKMEAAEAALKEVKALEFSDTVVKQRTKELTEIIHELNHLLEYKPAEMNNFSNII